MKLIYIELKCNLESPSINFGFGIQNSYEKLQALKKNYVKQGV